MPEIKATNLTLIGGEESYKNPLSQSPLAMRKLENFVPTLRGDLDQKESSRSFALPANGVSGIRYERTEPDGTVTRVLLVATSDGKVHKYVRDDETSSEIFPASTGFPVLAGTPVFVQAENNLVYFTDGERWYVTDGTAVTTGGLDFPVDAPETTYDFRPPTAAVGTNWTNPANALVDDDTFAAFNGTTQDRLRLTGFGNVVLDAFSGDPVKGIEVIVRGSRASTVAANGDVLVGLTKDGTALVGTEKTIQLGYRFKQTFTLGGAADLWGTTWTEAEVEAANFGVLIRDADTTAAGVNIFYVEVRVHSGRGTLNVKTTRYYWVAWADIPDAAAPEFAQWSVSSPRSVGTGPITNGVVHILRPTTPPPRASHWLVFASETDDDGTFGALLGVVPVATTTFEDQSPDLDEPGSAMVALRRPIRNSPMVPGKWATLHKGRIFAGGFNKVPVVIRNPSFDTADGAELDGWTADPNNEARLTVTSDTGTKFDGAGAAKVVVTAGSSPVSMVCLRQDVTRLLKPGRMYLLQMAVNYEAISPGTPESRPHLELELTGAVQTSSVIQAGAATGVWHRNGDPGLAPGRGSIWAVTGDPAAQLLLEVRYSQSGVSTSLTGYVDFIRIWEVLPPNQVAYSALEEVEGLLNGRGEESFPGSTATPFPDESSDVVNLLTYPAEAHDLVGGLSFNDALLVFSDVSGVPLLGDSFDDFGFSEQVTLSVGLADRFAIDKSRHGLFFLSSDLRLFQASVTEPAREISLPIRQDLAKGDLTLPVYLRTYDFGERAWMALTLTEGGTRRLRLFDLETRQWFKFTEWTTPKALVVHEPVRGKRVLLVFDDTGTSIRVVSDPLRAYPAAAGSNTIPAATFRQVLLDLGDPSSFKVWKNFLIHTNANAVDGSGAPTQVTVTFWLDPFDPDNPGSGISFTAQLRQVENLPELLRGFFGSLADAHGKRLLLEVTVASQSETGTFPTPKRVVGLEVTAEPTTAYSR